VLPSFAAAALPRGSALAWQIILGERERRDGVPPGCRRRPGAIVVQKRGVDPRHRHGRQLYFERLYPLGIEAIAEAVAAVAAGTARACQDESRATAQGLANDSGAVDWSRSARARPPDPRLRSAARRARCARAAAAVVRWRLLSGASDRRPGCARLEDGRSCSRPAAAAGRGPAAARRGKKLAAELGLSPGTPE
jgi:hypothetical protein